MVPIGLSLFERKCRKPEVSPNRERKDERKQSRKNTQNNTQITEKHTHLVSAEDKIVDVAVEKRPFVKERYPVFYPVTQDLDKSVQTQMFFWVMMLTKELTPKRRKTSKFRQPKV